MRSARRAADVETTVLERVTAHLTEPAEVAALLAELQVVSAEDGTRARLTAQLAQADGALRTLLDLAETGTVALPELRKRLGAREAQVAQLRAKLAELPPPKPVLDEAAARARLARVVTDLTAGDVAVRRRALASVVARVVLHDRDEIEIVWG